MDDKTVLRNIVIFFGIIGIVIIILMIGAYFY